MYKIFILALLAAGCSEQPTAGMQPGDPTPPASDDSSGAAPAGGEATGGGNPGGTPPLPTLAPGNYAAMSNGLLSNDCLAPPAKDGMLGTWAWKSVSAGVWNLVIAQDLPPAVVMQKGDALEGNTFESGMPLWGCQMRETYLVSLTPSSSTVAAGSIETRFEVISGDCSQYEPTLPCAQRYAIALTHD